MLDKINAIEARYNEINQLIEQNVDDYAKTNELMKERSDIEEIVQKGLEYKTALQQLDEAKDLAGGPDHEMADLAQMEIEELKPRIEELEKEIRSLLIPKDPRDSKNVIVEIRAGTGGEEAALFAGDLFRMYSRYCETQGWKIVVMSSNATSLDGYKEIVFTVKGEGSYGRFRFESGAYRVQRVPETEAQGRIHTSAATVVVFPEADEEDEIEIPEKDLRIDLFCAGGAGGQHVNKTESAVRMTHIPTGLVAVCQDERSQIRNREKCLATLKARILDFRRREEEAKIGADRLTLRGSGDRSDKIRTYNFPQNRLTDHRIGLTIYSLDRIVDGDLGPVLDALHAHDVEERIKAALEDR